MFHVKRIKLIRNWHFIINYIIILFISFLIYKTTTNICNRMEAREFLERAQYLPLIPWHIPIYCVILMSTLVVSNYIKSKFLDVKTIVVRLLCGLDIIIGLLISFYLNLSYKGILLLIIANIIFYIKHNRVRLIYVTILLMFYSFIDYDVISVKMNIFSINEYIDYYPDTQRIYFYSIKNIFESLNEVIFIMFLFMLLQDEIMENKHIKKLNEKLKTTANALRKANVKLEEYAKQSENIAKMKERNRLAREIHDILGHTLTGITTGIEACLAILPVNQKKATQQLNKILEISKKGLLDVRRSVRELKEDAIEKQSIVTSIKNLINDISECSNVNICLDIKGEEMKLKDDEKQTMLRVVQESITNSIRHGHAKKIIIELIFKYHEIYIIIQDDGLGCDVINNGFGLTHMSERVKMLNGEIEFHSKEDNGFLTKVKIPIRWGVAYD